MNVRAAFIHVLGDGIQSVGVMIAAALIWARPEWRIADPICTFVFSIIVLVTTVRLVKQSLAVLMEGSPDGIDPVKVEQKLRSILSVYAVHDLHIWSISVGKPSLSVHLLARTDGKGVLEAAHQMLATVFNIHHSTIQVELGSDAIACNPAVVAGKTAKVAPAPAQP
jgi:zinc transporter 2